jgi:hypothetical protein
VRVYGNAPIVGVPDCGESGHSRGFENFEQRYALTFLKKFVTGFPDRTHFPARAQLGDYLVEKRKLEFSGFLRSFCT